MHLRRALYVQPSSHCVRHYAPQILDFPDTNVLRHKYRYRFLLQNHVKWIWNQLSIHCLLNSQCYFSALWLHRQTPARVSKRASSSTISYTLQNDKITYVTNRQEQQLPGREQPCCTHAHIWHAANNDAICCGGSPRTPRRAAQTPVLSYRCINKQSERSNNTWYASISHK